MRKLLIIIASLLGAIGVIIGAFGAHAFKDTLEASGMLDTFNTAVEYHFYHTLAALIAPLLIKKHNQASKAKTASFLFLLGIVLFSGSLYVLCFTEATYIAFVTPIGGLSFIMGWLTLSYAAYRSQFSTIHLDDVPKSKD